MLHITFHENERQLLIQIENVAIHMVLEEGSRVILHDIHSKHNGEIGTIKSIVQTMFGTSNYSVEFEEGQEAGVGEKSLEELIDELEEE